MKKFITTSILGIMMFSSGCVQAPGSNQSTTTTTPAVGTPDNGKTRTYTINVQPVTQKCSKCHSIGDYGSDKDWGAGNDPKWVDMMDTKVQSLTAAQVKDVKDWLAAGRPADTTKF